MGPAKQEVLTKPAPFTLHNGITLNNREERVFTYLLTHDAHITPLPTDQITDKVVFRGRTDPKRALTNTVAGMRRKTEPKQGEEAELAFVTIDDPALKRARGKPTSSLKLYIADHVKEFYEKKRIEEALVTDNAQESSQKRKKGNGKVPDHVFADVFDHVKPEDVNPFLENAFSYLANDTKNRTSNNLNALVHQLTGLEIEEIRKIFTALERNNSIDCIPPGKHGRNARFTQQQSKTFIAA